MIPLKTGYNDTNITLEIKADNRYSVYPVYEDDEKNRFVETIDIRIADISDNDIYHIVTIGELYRWDLIAKKYYGDWRLKWVIMESNGVVDPFDMEVGMILRIPAYENLFFSDGPLGDF